MSMTDGGAAFPCLCQYVDGKPAGAQIGATTGWEMGMSLRDYFAAKAMAAMVAGDGARMVAERDETYDETNWAQVVASNAYAFSDAMLVERARQAPPLLSPPTT